MVRYIKSLRKKKALSFFHTQQIRPAHAEESAQPQRVYDCFLPA